MEWEQIYQFHLNPPTNRDILKRSPHTEKLYEKYLEKNLSNDDILNCVFNTSERISQGYRLIPNNFPYDVAHNIRHLVLWIHPDAPFTENNILEILGKKLKYTNWFCYQSIDILRSISNIPHYHVFVK